MMHADPQTASNLHNYVLGISVVRQVTLLLYINQIIVIKYMESHFDLMILNRKKLQYCNWHSYSECSFKVGYSGNID